MILEKLKEQAHFTNHEKEVAGYILEHLDRIPEMSSGELANASFTSKATVVRLSQKLGLAGYQEFRLRLVEEIHQKNRLSWRENPSRIKALMRILSVRFRSCMTRR